MSGSFGMINEIAEGRRATSKSFFDMTKRFGHYFGLILLRTLAFLVVALPLALFVLLAVGDGGLRVAWIVLAALSGILLILLWILLTVGLSFAVPILFRGERSPWKALVQSMRLLFSRPGHVLATFFLTLLIKERRHSVAQ